MRYVNFFQETKNELLTVDFTVSELNQFTKIAYYDNSLPHDHEDQGYQRRPNENRIMAFATHLEKSLASNNFLPIPTSIILSDRGVNYKMNNGKIDIIDGQFKLIDGQHRVLAYQKAIQEYDVKGLEAHAFPCTIVRVEHLDISDLEKKEIELRHFITINGKQKSVPVDLGNGLLLNLYRSGALTGEDMNEEKIIGFQIVEKLNNDCNAWKDKILMPNDRKYSKDEIRYNSKLEHSRIVRSTSLQNSLKPVLKYLNETHFTSNDSIEDKVDALYEILNNYWTVISDRCPKASKEAKYSVLHKSCGVFSLHHLLVDLMKDIDHTKSPKEKIRDKKSLDKRLVAKEECMTDHFWISHRESRGYASKFGNMGGFKELSIEMYDQLSARYKNKKEKSEGLDF